LSDFTSEFEAKDMMTSFTLDVIASAGLGVEARSFKEPNNLIRQKVRLFCSKKLSIFSIFTWPKISAAVMKRVLVVL
jgi:hypothetical protein